MTELRRIIALVDDDPRVLESLGELFESAGYAVRTHASAQALLEAGLFDIDCLVTDIGMPIVDGFELLDRAKKAQPELPVFLITGRHEIIDQQRASANDISGFFRKPFDGAALLTAVADALRTQGGSNAS